MSTYTNEIGEERGLGQGRWWALVAIALTGLVIALDTTVLVTALPTLSTKLGATTDELQWITAAYTLALAGLLLPAGVLGDRFGCRRLLLIGLLLFGIASAIASQMTSATGLIVMRAFMGSGRRGDLAAIAVGPAKHVFACRAPSGDRGDGGRRFPGSAPALDAVLGALPAAQTGVGSG